MRAAVGNAYTDSGASVEIDYGAGQPARIDGTVAGVIAVEIESRVSKQIRGAVLDLICHSYTKKLLVLLPVHMSDPGVAMKQCEHILLRFLKRSDFRVVLLTGSGDYHRLEPDKECVLQAVHELGYDPAVARRSDPHSPVA